MGRSKTRKKNQRSEQASDDQDPDVSETEPSSSENISESLNDTVVLSNSNNVMDTDVEDSEQTTGDSTPTDESDTGGDSKVGGGISYLIKPEISVSSTTGDVVEDEIVAITKSHVNKWLDNQAEEDSQGSQQMPLSPAPSVTCPHAKGSISMPGIRKALKSEVNVACSARPCRSSSDIGADGGDGDDLVSSTSKDVWFCLQCGHFGCGDHKGLGGDAESHFKTPRSDQHNVVLKVGGTEMNTLWCYTCQTYLDAKQTYFENAITFLKRHPKFRLSLQSNNKTGSAPAIALGPPPPPPQPETTVENNQQFKSILNNNKRNIRNKPGLYNWDNSSRDDWPLGLENLGNTCFMNSALQCLSRTRSLSPKLDLYGTGNTLEILVTADPPNVEVLGTVSPDMNGESASSIVQLGASGEGTSLMDENGDSYHVPATTESETGGSSPSSSEMDSLLDVASGTSSKSSPSKELTPENYKAEIEKELKKCLRLKLVIPKDSMTARLRHAFKAMTRSVDLQQGTGSYGSSEYFGRVGRHVFTPSAIHSSLAKHFRPGQQHDSHELLRTVVDMMKKDQIKAFRLAIMQCYGIKKSEGKNCDPKIAELLKMWDRKLYHKTFVDEIFGGELVTFQTCLTCQSVRKSHEDFLDLSLPIRVYTKTNHIPKRTYSIFDDDGDSNRSLEDCLNSFIEPEQLTGSNAVECENCHRKNLEKLEAGASFEEVFPGVKPPETAESRKSKPIEPEPAMENEMDALEPLGMEEEPIQAYSNATEDMDDLDEPAVDGILGNTSDMEDEGNDVPPVFLGDGEDKGASATDFLTSSDIPNKDNISLSLAATQDEGFSESDSSEEKKSASISASSSRNSISEADNVASSSKQKGKEVSKPIPITKCPCSRRQMVWRPPECLTIHLKRFQITSHGTSKLSDRVTFPYILNLTPFCAPSGDEVEDRDVFDEDGEVKYALYGIVEHSGSLHWGHYVAYIKVHGTSPPTSEESSSGTASSNNTEGTQDKWFYISDSSVSPSSLESVLGMDPYILFYERIRGQDKRDKLAQLQRLNNPCSSSSSSSSTVVAVPTSSTSQVAGYSFEFSNDSQFANNSLD